VSCAAHQAVAADWPRVERAISRGRWSNMRIELEPGDDLVRYVHVYPELAGRRLWHAFRFAFEGYPGLPPSVQCVHPLSHELPRVNQVRWWPRSSAPEVNLQPGTDPPYFCFPYTLEFTRTHAALAAGDPHRWTPATHTVFVTIHTLRRLFRAGMYTGYFDPSFEEELRAAMAQGAAAFAPPSAPPATNDSAA
jgi:hypothetical protein